LDARTVCRWIWFITNASTICASAIGADTSTIGRLRAAYYALKRDAAAGSDGETWQHYGLALEANLQDLAARITRGAFRASPVRRTYIPKADGRQRPLGVPTLDDKIVQRAVVEVRTAIYEPDFLRSG
jgi:retron-type reverse transcriptase